jgi:hypothetical protein
MNTAFRLTVPAFALAIFNVATGVVQAQFDYTTNYNGTLNLSLYTGTNAVVTIPGSNDGLTVTSIGSSAFDGSAIVTSVTIPNGVLTIHANAFDGCFNLTNVTIPNSVTNIEAYVFDNCSKLASVTLPNGLTSIEDDTFDYCSSLTSITIPDSVTYIGNDVFYACSKLTSVYFQGNAPSVGSDVFTRDHSLTAYYLSGTTGWGDFATLTGLTPVLWQPQAPPSIASFGLQSKQFVFTINGTSNLVVVVEATPALANPVWSPVGTNTLTGGGSLFTDPRWTNYPVRFYRLRIP